MPHAEALRMSHVRQGWTVTLAAQVVMCTVKLQTLAAKITFVTLLFVAPLHPEI